MTQHRVHPLKRAALPLLGALVAAAGVAALVCYRKAHPRPYPGAYVAEASVPRFRPAVLPFVHRHHRRSLPRMAAAVLDSDGDGAPELYLGGGAGQPDALLRFRRGAFEDISAGRGLDKDPGDPSYGAASLDVDGDGRTDLLVARHSGLYLYTNTGGGFSGRRLAAPFDAGSVPVAVALGDVDRDGRVDLFVSAMLPLARREGRGLFNRRDYGGRSVLLRGRGDGTFEDITFAAGLGYVRDAVQALFVDLDGDRQLDLVVAYDTGHVKTWRSMGNATFQEAPNPTSALNAYPGGLAVGDYDGDGRPDLFITNVGPTPPRFLARGDLRDNQALHTGLMLLRNEGGFNLRDVAAETWTAGYELSRGVVLEDFNLDGRQDLAIAQNAIDFLPHRLHRLFRLPGRLLVQGTTGTFAAVEAQAGVEERLFAVSPLTADWNGDGYPDLVWANLDGPARAFLSEGGGARYLKVVLRDEARSLGADVTVETGRGRALHGQLVTSEGLGTDSTHVLTFGLGDETAVRRVTVRYLAGGVETIEAPPVRSTVACRGATPPALPIAAGGRPPDYAAAFARAPAAKPARPAKLTHRPKRHKPRRR